MAWIKILHFVLVFLAGFLAGWFFMKGGITGEVVSEPGNFLVNNDVLVYDDEVVVKIPNARLVNYRDTGSMAPVLGAGMNGIVVSPESEEDINVGDIISFWKGKEIVVHRVVEKGVDSLGTYFITKGDRNDFNDGKIRFEEIEGLLVGVIY